jgi:hypothetical protein
VPLERIAEYNRGRRGPFPLIKVVKVALVKPGPEAFVNCRFSPFGERIWASLYEAPEDGQIDAERLRGRFVAFAPLAE